MIEAKFNRYKILSLPEYMFHFDRSFINEDYDSCEDYFMEDLRLTEVPVIFNHDGWYYDRYNKTSWFEYQGKAWTKDDLKESFLYELECLNTIELSEEVRYVMKFLKNRGFFKKEISKMLYEDDNRRTIRSIGLNGYKVIKRFEEFKRKRNLNNKC